MFPQGWHPQEIDSFPNGRSLPNRYTASRTAIGGVRYYYIDFGISSFHKRRVLGIHGQERAPELSENVPYDPYKLDVYILGKTYSDFVIKVGCLSAQPDSHPHNPIRLIQGPSSCAHSSTS